MSGNSTAMGAMLGQGHWREGLARAYPIGAPALPIAALSITALLAAGGLSVHRRDDLAKPD